MVVGQYSDVYGDVVKPDSRIAVGYYANDRLQELKKTNLLLDINARRSAFPLHLCEKL